MKKSLILTALLCPAIFCAAAETAKVAEVAEVASDSLVFAVNFDDTTDAVKSVGRAAAAEFRGVKVFEEGISGKAIRVGDKAGCPLYYTKDTLNFDNPGSVVIWFKADNWHGQKSGRGVGFWGLGNNQGVILIQTASGPEGTCPCKRPLELYLLHSKKRKNVRYLLQPPALTKLCQGWHMVSIAWEKENIFLSYDGAAYKSFKLQIPLSNEEFAHCNRFAIGSNYNKNYLVDNFRIYGKKLSDAELLQIWENGQKLLEK